MVQLEILLHSFKNVSNDEIELCDLLTLEYPELPVERDDGRLIDAVGVPPHILQAIPYLHV